MVQGTAVHREHSTLSSHTILLIEGRKATSERWASALDDVGKFNIITAHTRREALAKIEEISPSVIVLDSTSVRFSSRRFCRTLQEAEYGIPVLMLLNKEDKIDPSIGVRAHLRYPFSGAKLLRRIERLLPMTDDDLLQVGDVVLNTKQRCVTRGGREAHLTPRQALLLETFMRHPGEILSRAYLMKQVWETNYIGDTRTLDVHIHWVRKAIEDDYKSPRYIQTVRHVGYRFEIPGTGETQTAAPEEANEEAETSPGNIDDPALRI